MKLGHRDYANYWAFVAHRVSGLALAVFLPIHLNLLGMGIKDAAAFDSFLGWTEQPLVKLAEAGLVACLALHLTGGLRILAIEFLPWSERQKTAIAISCGMSLAAALAFLLNAG
jgi:fumarate reductase subunit D